MGNTAFGDADRVNRATSASPQNFEIDRGNVGCVRVSDRI